MARNDKFVEALNQVAQVAAALGAERARQAPFGTLEIASQVRVHLWNPRRETLIHCC